MPTDIPQTWPAGLDALVAAPEHHRLLFENEHVRVLDTRIPSGARTAVHTHRWPATLYVLSWSAFVRRDAEGLVMVDSRLTGLSVSPGSSVWVPAFPAHSLENVGDEELHVIAVELKQVMG